MPAQVNVTTKPNPNDKAVNMASNTLIGAGPLTLLASWTKNRPPSRNPKNKSNALAYPNGMLFNGTSVPSPRTFTGGINVVVAEENDMASDAFCCCVWGNKQDQDIHKCLSLRRVKHKVYSAGPL